MKKVLLCSFSAALLALPAFGATVEGILIDNMCSAMVEQKGVAAAKAHTKQCALMDNCKDSGFAIVTADGKVVKLDDKGNELAVKALEGTKKNNNLTAKVEGEVSEDTISVSSLNLD